MYHAALLLRAVQSKLARVPHPEFLRRFMVLWALGLFVLTTQTTYAAELSDAHLTSENSGVVRAPSASVSKCSGGSFKLFEDPDNNLLVRLEDMTFRYPTNGGVCGLRGYLRIKLPGNDLRVYVEGDVDRWDQFISTWASPITLNIAGLTLRSYSPRVYPDKVVLGYATLTAPSQLGGKTVPLLITPRIDENGLRLSSNLSSSNVSEAFNLPTFTVPSGLELFGLKGSLVSEADGYKFTVEGTLSLPFMKKKAKAGDDERTIGIEAKFSIFTTASGAMVIQVMPADNGQRIPIPVSQVLGPDAPDAPNGCYYGSTCLSEVGLSLEYDPGINLDQGAAGGSIWLTGVRGNITVLPHKTSIDIGVTIETSTVSVPGLGSAISVEGDAHMQFAPSLELGLKAALKFFVLQVANAEVEYKASKGFRAYIGGFGGIAGIPLRFEGEVRVWGSGKTYYAYTSGPVYIAGSGRAGWYIKKGEIYQSCTWLPCGVRWCKRWGIPYPCGINRCYTCLTIPPSELWLGGGQADIGRFKGGFWGIKGAVHFLTYSAGVFLDLTNKKVTLGNVNGYVLDAPTALRAMAVRAAGTSDAVVSAAGVQVAVSQVDANTLLLKTPVGVINRAPAELSVLRDAALNQGGLQAAAALDAITTTQVITQTDTIFSISMTEPLTPSLFTPNGTEITIDNYRTSPEGLTIEYTERYTYTEAAAPTDSRVRFVSTLYTPVTATLKVDGVSKGTDSVYESPYVSVTPGTHTVTVEPTPSTGLPSISASVNVITGTDSTVLIHYNSANQLTATVFNDSRTPPSGRDKGLVRFINVLGNRNDPLSLYVDGQLIGQAAPGQATAYVELPAGDYHAEVWGADNTVVLTATLTLLPGDHRALVASSQIIKDQSNNNVTAAGLTELVEVVNSAVTFKEFFIDQAPVGEWQVQLLGDTSVPTWRVAVLSAANPPVISDFVAQQREDDPYTVDVSLRVKSDYAPTKVTLFATPGPITVTTIMTDNNGIAVPQTIPNFHGQEVTYIESNDPGAFDGSFPIPLDIDLSYLETGEYYIWAQVEDGVNPAVNQYATSPTAVRAMGSREVRIAAEQFDPLVQYAGATPIRIDHTASFPNHFATTVITPMLHVEFYEWKTQPEVCNPPKSDPDCEQGEGGEWGKWVPSEYYPFYMEWTASHHPDTDSYVVEIEPIHSPIITTTQVITVGDTVYGIPDDTGNIVAWVGGFGWQDIAPDSTYRLRVGAIDYDTNRVDWSPSREITVPLGTIALRHLDSDIARVPVGGYITHTIVLSMSPDIFYEVEGEVDRWNLPPEVELTLLDEEMQPTSDGFVSLRGRLAPSTPPTGPRDSVKRVTRVASDGSATVQAASRLENFEYPVTLAISAAENAPEGLYTVTLRAINGPSEAELNMRIIVGHAKLYLPLIERH